MSQLDISSTALHVELRSTGTDAGQGVFATDILSPGDTVIAVNRPLFAALDAPRLGDTCYHCYRQAGTVPVEVTLGFGLCPLIRGQDDAKEVELSRCAGCKTVRYCSQACQRSSWKAHHSLECSVFKTIYPKELASHISAVLRVLLLRKAGKITTGDWDAFMLCSSHTETFAHSTRVHEMALVNLGTKDVTQSIPFPVEEELVKSILMRLKINGITLQTPFHEPLGLVLHPLLARINHDCLPNCYVRFPGPTASSPGTFSANPGSIIVTPLRKIEVGEEITISYIDVAEPVYLRLGNLNRQFFFRCRCSRCQREENFESKFEGRTKEGIDSLQNQGLLIVNNAISNRSASTQTIRGLTDKIREIFVFSADWILNLCPFPQLLHELILHHIDAQNFPVAFRLLCLLHFRVDPLFYSPTFFPLRLTHSLLLVKMLGAMMDNIPPLSSSPDAATLELSREVDLQFWQWRVIGSMISEAGKTWTEQPWPWLGQMYKQMDQSSCREIGTQNTGLAAREQRRMAALCDRTLEDLKHG